MNIEGKIEGLEAMMGVNVEPMVFYIIRPGADPSEEAKQTALAKAMQERPAEPIYIIVMGGEQNVG